MNNSKFTPEQLKEMMDAVITEMRTTLTSEHTNGILQRIKREHLTPFDSGYSLHCWNQEYMVDGGHYSLTGELSNPIPFVVELVQPRC